MHWFAPQAATTAGAGLIQTKNLFGSPMWVQWPKALDQSPLSWRSFGGAGVKVEQLEYWPAHMWDPGTAST